MKKSLKDDPPVTEGESQEYLTALRDSFAKEALRGVMRKAAVPYRAGFMAETAYLIADAMMVARGKDETRKRPPLPGYDISIDDCTHPDDAVTKSFGAENEELKCHKCGICGERKRRIPNSPFVKKEYNPFPGEKS